MSIENQGRASTLLVMTVRHAKFTPGVLEPSLQFSFVEFRIICQTTIELVARHTSPLLQVVNPLSTPTKQLVKEV